MNTHVLLQLLFERTQKQHIMRHELVKLLVVADESLAGA
jgi:hypothetical protein